MKAKEERKKGGQERVDSQREEEGDQRNTRGIVKGNIKSNR